MSVGPGAISPWLAWLAVGVVAALMCLAIDAGPVQDLLYYGLGFVSAGLVVAGIRRSHVRPAAPWWLLAAGIGLTAAGDIVWDALASFGGVSGPTLADLAYLAGSIGICLAAALYLLRPGRRLVGLLDGIIVGAAFSVILWTFVIEHMVELEAISLPELVTLVAYPSIDVAMLGIVIVAVMGGHPLDRSGRLFALAALAFLASDTAYAILAAEDAYVFGLVDAGWLLGYVLWGAAALALAAPSRATAVASETARRWRMLRPVIRITAVLMPLVAALYDTVVAQEGFPVDEIVASAIISVVVIVRLELSVNEKQRLLSERERLEASLQQQAAEDPLTGLPNRRGMAMRLVAALDAPDNGIGLLVLDLDDFKAVNDTHGHQVGDELLQELAERLRASVRLSDTVARYGGDEFAIVVTPCRSSAAAVGVAERVLANLVEPIETSGGRLALSASIGIALSTLSGPSAEHLLRDADLALYEAKAAGKHRLALLDADARHSALRSLSVAGELPRAIANDELRLVFQPLVSLADGRVESMEALVRWQHPDFGLLSPGEFLPAAERSARMPEIGRWVMAEACAAAAAWRRRGHDVGVNVNVSTSQLADEGYAAHVLEGLDRVGLPPAALTLELLESSLDTIPGIHERLASLRAAGVRLAVDDFGTGYSSLSRLATLPVSELKLDRSVIAGVGNERMVRAVAQMGQTLGLRLVAEGVEDEAELRLVQALGYDAVQGYLLGRPVEAAKVPELLASWQASEDVPLSTTASFALAP